MLAVEQVTAMFAERTHAGFVKLTIAIGTHGGFVFIVPLQATLSAVGRIAEFVVGSFAAVFW